MQKLELTWIGKGQEPVVEPRILLHDASNDYGDPNTTNMLIHGDNLLALKALEQEFAGRVKCVYIDPPYNTGSAFEHYDDNLEHSIWLRLMKSRLEILRNLLRSDGFFACHIDDSESHYLKVLLDETFGRDNYQTTLYIRVRYPEKTLKQDMSYHKEIEQVHIYRREYGAVPNFDSEVVGFDKFRYYVEDDGTGETITLGGKRVDIFQHEHYTIEEREGSEFGLKEIWASGTILDGNSSGRFFRDYLMGRADTDGLGVLYKVWGIGDDRFDFRYFTGPQRKTATKGKYYQGVPIDKLVADEVTKKVAINNFYDLAGNFGNCRLEGGVEFRSGKKPEALLELILRHFSAPGDIVLDSFLGSGTTVAVAQKMGRQYIGIEIEEHCYTHCLLRLKAVVDGDSTGISSIVGWNGGGGFKFYELAPTLIVRDENGFEIISDKYDATMLAASVAKLCGYRFTSSEDNPYIHGVSSAGGFIFVTTQHVTALLLDRIAKYFTDAQSLVICASSFQIKIKNNFPNIKLRKIPQSVLSICEYGADNYNLNVVELPDFEDTEEDFEYVE